MAFVRRLTAILAADVAGYSRLMGADEEGTHERLKAHLGNIVEAKITEQRDRVVKNTGYGFLAEFQSVIDAVRCAVEVQRGWPNATPQSLRKKRIEFRIGINLGDVIAEDEDIFGDGVNFAARLEALAEPGGICVSRFVRDQMRDRLDYTFEDLNDALEFARSGDTLIVWKRADPRQHARRSGLPNGRGRRRFEVEGRRRVCIRRSCATRR
jgi:adenylate cyclase